MAIVDPVLIDNFNPGLVYINLSILKYFDERPSCPLFWSKEAEFILDPRDMMNLYNITNEEYPPGLSFKLNSLSRKPVLFKRCENWSKIQPSELALAPGYFKMYVQSDSDPNIWVSPYPDYYN